MAVKTVSRGETRAHRAACRTRREGRSRIQSLRTEAGRKDGKNRGEKKEAAHRSVRLLQRGDLEHHSSIVVLLAGGVEIKIGERNLAMLAGSEIEES